MHMKGLVIWFCAGGPHVGLLSTTLMPTIGHPAQHPGIAYTLASRMARGPRSRGLSFTPVRWLASCLAGHALCLAPLDALDPLLGLA